jgi:predicted transcriptional regulator|tara:strand:+ start:6323 stop:6721 length:399 start_codon:yes stop_codon:yes gene_type:complete
LKREKKKHDFLTEVELEFMNKLWTLGEATVREVLDKLPNERGLAYTSASTILRILEQKNFVASKKDGKSHVYRAILDKHAYQARSLRDLSFKLFDDMPASLVARLVDDDSLSEEALSQIRELVDKRLKNGSD